MDLRLATAVHYLRANGETVKPSGLGLWTVNGMPQRPAEIIEYAEDLQRAGRSNANGTRMKAGDGS